mmetsp:Transcript_4538/g.12197  ORF Transcript_4538/g.12197 Transcript_4538/m.12197 type:complete len:231 (-) Transcript_4538:507-1199(-)
MRRAVHLHPVHPGGRPGIHDDVHDGRRRDRRRPAHRQSRPLRVRRRRRRHRDPEPRAQDGRRGRLAMGRILVHARRAGRAGLRGRTHRTHGNRGGHIRRRRHRPGRAQRRQRQGCRVRLSRLREKQRMDAVAGAALRSKRSRRGRVRRRRRGAQRRRGHRQRLDRRRVPQVCVERGSRALVRASGVAGGVRVVLVPDRHADDGGHAERVRRRPGDDRAVLAGRHAAVRGG